jgi:hypothetical protein
LAARLWRSGWRRTNSASFTRSSRPAHRHAASPRQQHAGGARRQMSLASKARDAPTDRAAHTEPVPRHQPAQRTGLCVQRFCCQVGPHPNSHSAAVATLTCRHSWVGGAAVVLKQLDADAAKALLAPRLHAPVARVALQLLQACVGGWQRGG